MRFKTPHLMFFFTISFVSVFLLGQAEGKEDYKSVACMDCHDDIPAFTHKTAHNPAFKVKCEDCHTGNEEHIDDPEPTNIVARGKAVQERCLTCHQDLDHGPLFKNNQHGSADLYCGDCHSLHDSKTPPKFLLQKPVSELCASCHSDVATSFNKPYSHNLQHAGMDCNSCHDLHGQDKPLVSAFAGQPACLACHQEKAGPFVFEHVTGLAGDCMSCHEPHGSANPKQLTRARVDQLCLECHTTQNAITLGSQPPAIHDLRSPRYQNCTTCHTAVHGSHRSPLLLK